ncbi:hypothetical protein D3C71_1316290 [compost metagenome]
MQPFPERACRAGKAVADRPLPGRHPRPHAARVHGVPGLLAAPRPAALAHPDPVDRGHGDAGRGGQEGLVPGPGHRTDLGPCQLQRHGLLRGHGQPPAPHHRHADGRPGGQDRRRAPGQRPPGLQRTVQHPVEDAQGRPPGNHRAGAGAAERQGRPLPGPAVAPARDPGPAQRWRRRQQPGCAVPRIAAGQ